MQYPNKQNLAAAAIPVWIAPNSVPGGLRFISYEQVTDLSSAVPLTPPAGATFALVQVQDGNVRYRRDGTSPTGSVGMILWATSQPMGFAVPNADLEFINMSGGTAALNVEYYGEVA